MKISLESLQEFIVYNNKEVTAYSISQKLNEIGVENEIIENYSYLDRFQVAKIVNVEQHPKASKLNLCKVDYGQESTLQVICGASNVKLGMNVVLAKIGVKIPYSRKKIKKSKIKDYLSEGMLCSYEELLLNDLSQNAGHIIELPTDSQKGEQVIKYLNLNYHFDIEVTPNRGEILSIYGLAKELASSGLVQLKDIPQYITTKDEKFLTKIKIENDQSICPIFAIRELSNINNNIHLPEWFKLKLKFAEINSVSPIIDIANYTTYKFGQPLHIYDKDKIDEQIIVGQLNQNNLKFNGLDKIEYLLQKEDVVVKGKDDNVYSLAGIIGSLDSACNIETQNIVIEAGVFNSSKISNSSNRLKLVTDAKFRFEKNINLDLVVTSLNYATKLILEICGGKASQVAINQKEQKEKEIIFSKSKFYKHIGVYIEDDTINNILKNLNFKTVDISEDLKNIKVPVWRKDIELQEDMDEEILRIYGYDKVDFVAPKISSITFLDSREKLLAEIRKILSSMGGYYESISYSFTDKEHTKDFYEIYQELEILNPISSEANYMRPSLLINYLPIIEKNINKSLKNFSLFEIGKSFHGKKREEVRKLILIRVGLKNQTDYFNAEMKFDIFDLKTDLQMILDHLNINYIEVNHHKHNIPRYMLYEESINIEMHNKYLGYYGKINNNILAKYNLQNTNILVMELDIDNLLDINMFRIHKTRDLYNDISYQPLIREYNFVMNKNIALGEVIKFLHQIDEKRICNVRLINIHNESKDKNAVTFSLKIQDQESSISENMLKKLHEKIIFKTESKFLCKIKDGKDL